MNWDAIGAVGEVVGAVAVVVTLVYLTIQLRQNTRTMKLSTHHETKTAYNALHIAFGSDPGVSILLDRGAEDYSQLKREERFRYAMLMRASFGLHGDMFLQYQEGLISEEEWGVQSRSTARALAPRGAKTWSVSDAEIFPTAFRREVERILTAGHGHDSDQL